MLFLPCRDAFFAKSILQNYEAKINAINNRYSFKSKAFKKWTFKKVAFVGFDMEEKDLYDFLLKSGFIDNNEIKSNIEGCALMKKVDPQF